MSVTASQAVWQAPEIPHKYDVIPIHNSDRGSFKRCRRYWDWSSPARNSLTLRADIHGVKPELWFGTGIHYALENFYSPGLSRDPVESWKTWYDVQWNGGMIGAEWLDLVYDLKPRAVDSSGNPIKTGQDPELFSVRGLREILPDPDESEFEALFELGVNMMEAYKTYASKYDGFEVLVTEHDFSVPIWDYENDCILKAIDVREQSPNYGKLLEVHSRGRMDAIWSKPNGKLGVIDHKAQPLDEPILTPGGWVNMGDLVVGSQVTGYSGKPTTVVGVFPQGELDCAEIEFSDGAIVRASLDHLWTVYSNDCELYKRGRVMTTDEIWASNTKWSVPVFTDPVEFEENDLPIDPYIVGALIGDGYLGGSSVVLSATEIEIVDRVADALPFDHEIYKYKSNNNSWGIARRPETVSVGSTTAVLTERRLLKNDVLVALRELGLHGCRSADKFIPQQYLFSSVENRIALLQGLMDTDGNCYKGHSTYRTISKQLCADVEFLVRSLGGVARTNGSKYCRVSIRLPREIQPFSLSRKVETWRNSPISKRDLTRYIKSVRLVGTAEMQCIKVSDEEQLYTTNGLVLTHNTSSRIDEDFFEKLDTDEQCTSYLYAAEVEAQYYGLPYAGQAMEEVIYNVLRKTFPQPPTVVRGGLFSVDRQNESCTYEMLMEFCKDNGIDLATDERVTEKHQNYVAWLRDVGDEQFIIRKQVRRNRHQLRSAGYRMYLEALDMLDPNIRIYPSLRNDFQCLRCAFRAPCLAKEDGGDWQQMIDDNYSRNRDR